MNNARTNPAKQQNTNTVAPNNGNLVSLVDEDFYFDYDGYDVEDTFVSPLMNSSTHSFHSIVVDYGDVMPNIGLSSHRKRNEAYLAMLANLEVIDLSFNNLKKIPGLIYELKNLKEIYFNGNLLKKIPNEMYTKPPSLEDAAHFEHLKELQKIKIEEELAAERRRNNEDDDFDEEEIEEAKPKKKNKKKKKGAKGGDDEMPQIEPVTDQFTEPPQEPPKLLAESLEVIQLNANKIEHVPENLFSNFKSLREIKLKDNPLKEPPQESVCISAVFKRNFTNMNSAGLIKSKSEMNITQEDKTEFGSTSITLLEKNTNKLAKPSTLASEFQEDAKFFDKNKFNLPNLFFETNENLKPLQSYMDKYKKREGLNYL